MCAPSLNLHILTVTSVPPTIHELFFAIPTIAKAFDFGAHHSKSTTPTLASLFFCSEIAVAHQHRFRVLGCDGVALWTHW
jgi:hypothetical protein